MSDQISIPMLWQALWSLLVMAFGAGALYYRRRGKKVLWRFADWMIQIAQLLLAIIEADEDGPEDDAQDWQTIKKEAREAYDSGDALLAEFGIDLKTMIELAKKQMK